MMIGYLGWAQWLVTVVSSNFVSLLLIITLSLIIHLIVRYRELATIKPEASQYELVSETIHSKFTPSFYTSVTTMVAFGSLLVSGIRPVIDFGWMMVIGIVRFVPARLHTVPRRVNAAATFEHASYKRHDWQAITTAIANFIQHRTRAAMMFFVALVVVALTGIPKVVGRKPIHRLLQGQHRNLPRHDANRSKTRWHDPDGYHYRRAGRRSADRR